jgi:antirestriction protein ArdC
MNRTYERVNGIIIDALESGTVPWQKPWASMDSNVRNFVSNKPYQGINHLILNCTGFVSPYYMTYKQATEAGGQVKKGSKSLPVVYWNFVESTKDATKRIPFIKHFSVFNACQIDGIDFPEPEKRIDFKPIAKAQEIVDGMPNAPAIVQGEARAYYRPSKDTVNMPDADLFSSPEEYYSTLFHELGHSTGHASRLDRKKGMEATRFKSHEYSKEELVAELTSAYLCADSGIDNTIANSAAYIEGWLKALKDDHKLLIGAAGKAGRAAKYIRGEE